MFSNWTAKKKSEMILLCCCAFVSFRLVLSDSAANLRAKVMWCVAIYGFTNSNPSLLLIYTLFDSDSSNAFYLHKCSQSIFSSDTLILHFFLHIYLYYGDFCFSHFVFVDEGFITLSYGISNLKEGKLTPLITPSFCQSQTQQTSHSTATQLHESVFLTKRNRPIFLAGLLTFFITFF